MTRDDIIQRLMHAKTSFETKHLLEELSEFDKDKIKVIRKGYEMKNTKFHGDFTSMDDDEQDDIINPAHYKVIPSGNYPDGLEYMDLMTYILSHHNGVDSHLLGQILKYSIRLGKKDDKLQDAKKIQWYANYLVKVIEQENES
jgi:hypothetical protein